MRSDVIRCRAMVQLWRSCGGDVIQRRVQTVCRQTSLSHQRRRRHCST